MTAASARSVRAGVARRVQIRIRRRQLGVPEPARHRVQRPTALQLARTHLVAQIVEVQTNPFENVIENVEKP